MKNKVIIVFLVTIIDQATKFWAISEGPRYVWPIFNIVILHNSGITFGLMPNISQGLLWFATGLIIAYVIWELSNASLWYTRLAYGFILGGAFGNIIDRLRYGFVVDFIDVHWNHHHYPWPFNLADSFIVLGIIVLIFATMRKK